MRPGPVFILLGAGPVFIPLGVGPVFIPLGVDPGFIPLGAGQVFIPLGADPVFIPLGGDYQKRQTRWSAFMSCKADLFCWRKQRGQRCAGIFRLHQRAADEEGVNVRCLHFINVGAGVDTAFANQQVIRRQHCLDAF